jgi:hypothetical protein
MHNPLHPTVPPTIVKPFCMRFDWPGQKPLAITLRPEDVAHCLLHTEMQSVDLVEKFKTDIRAFMDDPSPDYRMISQILFYFCTTDSVYVAAGGVPTIDFAWIRADHGWAIQFGKQDPDPEHVRMIKAVRDR